MGETNKQCTNVATFGSQVSFTHAQQTQQKCAET